MTLTQCIHDMKPGIAIAPVLGSNSQHVVERGDTIYPVGGEVVQVSKCAKCGYSIKFDPLSVRTINPNIPSRVVIHDDVLATGANHK